MESTEQGLLKDSNSPLPGMYIVASIIIILVLIVAILGGERVSFLVSKNNGPSYFQDGREETWHPPGVPLHFM